MFFQSNSRCAFVPLPSTSSKCALCSSVYLRRRTQNDEGTRTNNALNGKVALLKRQQRLHAALLSSVILGEYTKCETLNLPQTSPQVISQHKTYAIDLCNEESVKEVDSKDTPPMCAHGILAMPSTPHAALLIALP